MKSFFLPCAVCDSMDSETLFPSFYGVDMTPLQSIVICRNCGLVYRNPHIPEICELHYQRDKDWNGGFPDHFEERFSTLARHVGERVPLAPGEWYMDVGAGPGWFAQHLHVQYPDAHAVLLEPAVDVAAHAKKRNPNAVALPSLLTEADLPQGRFSLITACGVDYLFQDHRRDIETIWNLLRDGGVFYLERNVFIDQKALHCQPLFDVQDTFGLNHRMNTWFGREQLGEYLAEYFDVFERRTYDFDGPGQFSRRNVMEGYYCRKRRNGQRVKPTSVPNRYEEHLSMLRAHSVESSLEDLRQLGERGVRTVIISGCGPEARALAQLVREHDLFDIAGFIEPGPHSSERDELAAQFATVDPTASLDAILIASVQDQEGHLDGLMASGLAPLSLRCFRPGVPMFWSQGSTGIQMKAFLPFKLDGQKLQTLVR